MLAQVLMKPWPMLVVDEVGSTELRLEVHKMAQTFQLELGLPQNRLGGSATPRGDAANNSRGVTTSIASVQVQLNDGSLETREIIVGLTSRVSAEVISGLQAGELVVSGVVQGNVNGVDRDQLRSALGIPSRR